MHFNDLGTITNVPNVSITYLAIVYSYNGSPSDMNFGIVNFSNTNLVTVSLDLVNGNSPSTDPLNPSVLEYTIPSPLTAALTIPLRVAIWGTTMSNNNNVFVRSIVIGYL
jgi:hypothetical protein